MFVLSAHALISIIISIGSVHLFNLIWEEYIRRKRDQSWIELSSRFVRTPLAFLSLAWGLITCGLLLIWITLLWHVLSFAMQLPPGGCITPILSGT